MPAGKLAIGIDLGATKIASVLLAEDGSVLAASQVPTDPAGGPNSVLDRIADQIHAMLRESPRLVAGVGVGSPGKVDSSHGIVLDAVNLGWSKVDLAAELTRRIGPSMPVWVQKDANLSALGEFYYGACQACPDFVFLGLGSGLGGGIISGGRLLFGGDWYAAELGHLSLDPAGPACACGGRGCAETIASGPGLARITRELLAGSMQASLLSGRVELSPADVLAAAEAGDSLALTALSEVGRALGIVMSTCAAILNPLRFVIGGGLGLAAFDFILPAARDELARRTIPNTHSRLEIVRSRVESPAIGSACLVWYALTGRLAAGFD